MLTCLFEKELHSSTCEPLHRSGDMAADCPQGEWEQPKLKSQCLIWFNFRSAISFLPQSTGHTGDLSNLNSSCKVLKRIEKNFAVNYNTLIHILGWILQGGEDVFTILPTMPGIVWEEKTKGEYQEAWILWLSLGWYWGLATIHYFDNFEKDWPIIL